MLYRLFIKRYNPNLTGVVRPVMKIFKCPTFKGITEINISVHGLVKNTLIKTIYLTAYIIVLHCFKVALCMLGRGGGYT